MIRRRLLTVTGMICALWLIIPLLPALFVCALIIDLVRGAKTFSTTRLTGFLFCFLVVENIGLAALFFTFLTTRAGTRARHQRTFTIQRAYTAGHLWSVQQLFSLRFVVEGSELAATGPFVALVRHASLVDVLVPGGFIANVHHIELRYVLKKELLVEPCLDLAGHWIPNHFVDRGGGDTERELSAIRELKAGIGEREGVLLYPEGTRFSRRKREKLLEGPDKARAEPLKHLLPVRPGGALTLLDAAPSCDVLFVGHHGLEGLTRVKDIWQGTLVGKTVTIRFWREPAASIPSDSAARLAWLDAHWQRIDNWLETLE